MKALVSRLPRYALCIAAGLFITLLELRFFDGVAVFSGYFWALLAVTSLAVFLYARSDSSVVFVFIYTICLTLALEITGGGADISALLLSFFALALLYAAMRLKHGRDKTPDEKRPHFMAVLTAAVCACVILLATYRIYTHVLLPFIPEDAKYALLTRDVTPETPQSEPLKPTSPPIREILDENAANGGGADDLAAPLPPRKPIAAILALIILAAAVCFFILSAAYKYNRCRRWLKATLNSPPERQLREFYCFFLRALAACGFPRYENETPLEYSASAPQAGLPLAASELCELTSMFVEMQYGGAVVTTAAAESCAAIFTALPSRVKACKGKRFYYLRYVPSLWISNMPPSD